ncbi:MAG TPA: hypothetical protein VII13_14010 [Vicinamibacteria bacterium]
MAHVVWDPAESAPPDAGLLEAEIERVAPGAQVKLTLREDTWRVRALLSAALCTRGAGLSARDASAAVVEVLDARGIPACLWS